MQKSRARIALNIMKMYKQKTKSKAALTALMFKSLLDPYQLLHILSKKAKIEFRDTGVWFIDIVYEKR